MENFRSLGKVLAVSVALLLLVSFFVPGMLSLALVTGCVVALAVAYLVG